MAEKASIVIGATDESGPAFASAQRNMQLLQKAAGATAQQHQIAAVQVKDFIEQIISGGSPIRAFAQQGAAVVSNYGGVGKTFAALGSLISPVGVAIAAVTVGVGLLGAAFIAGAKESKAFADAVALTGNFSGQTAGQFDAAAKSIAASTNTTTATVREFGQAIIATGQIGPINFRAATQAAVLYGKATGKTADDVAKDFASMGDNAAKWAAEHNRSLHFINAAQYEQIKALQDAGRAGEAQALVYEAMSQHIHTLDGNLGLMDRTLTATARGWDKFWTAAKGFDKPKTTEERLQELNRNIAISQATRSTHSPGDTAAVTSAQAVGQASQNKLLEARAQELRRLMRETENASAQAFRSQQDDEGTAARARIDELLLQAKYSDALSLALAKNSRDFQAAEADGKGFTDEQKKAVNDLTRRQFSQGQTSDLQKTLDGRLKALQDEAEQEHDLFQNSETLLTALYQHGDLSIEQYFAAKQAAADDDLKKQRANLDKRIADIQSHKDALKGLPLEPEALKTAQQDDENKINALLAEQAKLERESGQAATASGLARTTALEESAKAFRDVDAQIADLNGDRATAQQIRDLQAVDDAHQKILSKQTGGDAARENALKNAIYLQGQFNKVQADASDEASVAQAREELFNIAAQRAGLDRQATEQGLLDLHEKRIAQMDAEIARVGDLIALSRLQNAGFADPALIKSYNDLQVAREKAFDAKDPGLQRFNQLAKQGGEDIANAFEDAVIQGGKLSDILQKLGLDLGRLVLHDLVTQPLADTITGGIKSLGKVASDAKATPAAVDAAGGVGAAGVVVGSFAPAIGTATTALGGFSAALANASGSIGAAQGTIPTAPYTIGQPGPVVALSSGSTEDAAATVAADKAIADLGETAKGGAKDLGAATGSLVQGVASVTASMGGLPGAFSQLISGIISLASSASSSGGAGFFSSVLSFFGGSSSGTGGTTGGGGTWKGGGAAAGGPAPAGSFLQVNERGPELLAIDGKQFLMMGREPGRIVPSDRVAPALAGAGLMADGSSGWRTRDAGGGGNVYINNHTPAQVSAARDDKGDWQIMVEAAAKQAHQMVAADHMSGSGPSSAALRKRGVNLDGSNPRRQ